MKRVIVKRKLENVAGERKLENVAGNAAAEGNPADREFIKPTGKCSDIQIDRIIHLSDIHIRPLQRHDEFQQVFQRTVDYISTISSGSIAVITGDVFDNKTVFRPETFKLCRDFLKSLSSTLPVYLIAGNHDMLESNVSRMDSLTPLVEDIPGLTYLKYSGVYPVTPNLSFVVSSLYDKQFIRSIDIEKQDGVRYVALFHGTVVSAKTDDGYEVKAAADDSEDPSSGSERHRTLEMFSGFDAVLLGDIHKRQRFTLDNGAVAAYAGSLIQQNYGERIAGHGLLVWDADTLIPSEIDIHNDYGHVDIHIQNGVWTNGEAEFPKRSYVRYVIKDSTEEQVNIINARIKSLTEIVRVDRRQCIGDVRDIEEIPPEVKQHGDELELIYEQAVEMGLPPDPLVALHQVYQTEIQGVAAAANGMSTAIWRPIAMEFKNLFGYGGDRTNNVNFRNGVTSITAANATGKTSIVNILLFAIFGRTPLNPVTSSFTYDIVNSTANGGYVKIQMEHGGNKYIIERRSLKRSKTTTAAAVNKFDFSCELWRCNDMFVPVENMSDVRKKNTDTMIIELFGDIDDFSIANFLNKESSTDILTMSAADQIRALKRLFRLNIYDDYRDLNKKRLSESLTSIQNLLNRKTYIESSIAGMPTAAASGSSGDTNEDEIKETLAEMRDNLAALEDERKGTVDELIRITENIDSGLPIMTDAACNQEMADVSRELGLITDVKSTGTVSNVLAYALSQIPATTCEQPPPVVPHDIAAYQPINEIRLKTELHMVATRLDALEKYPARQSDIPVTEMQSESREIVKQLESLPNIDILPIITRLEDLKSQETDGIVAELSHLEENTRDIADATTEIGQLSRRQEELLKLRSNRSVTESAEALKSQLVNIGTRTLYDTSGIPALQTAIRVINDRIRKGEVGRIDKMLEYLTGSEITEDHIEEIVQYLLEKRSGNYDPSIVKDNAQLAKSGAELAELERLTEINRTVERNLEIEADLYELEYLENGKRLLDLDCTLELLYITRNIIQTALSESKILKDIQELEHSVEKHESRERLLTRLESIQCDMYSDECYRLIDKQERLTAVLTYLEHKAKYDASLERKRLESQLESQLLYERRSQLVDRLTVLDRIKANNRYKRQRTEFSASLRDIEADITAQRESILEYETELTGAIKAREYGEYRTRLTDELAATEAQIVALQQAHVPYENYAKIMNPKGIAAKLLYSKILSIQDYINTITERFTKYRISILYDDSRQTINVLTENKATGGKLSITRLSGYEKLMLQLAFKRALNKFSYNSKSSLIIIDEALDCIDQDNFASRLPDVVSMLAQDYGVTVAISQRDITHISDNIIKLNSVNGISRVIDGR